LRGIRQLAAVCTAIGWCAYRTTVARKGRTGEFVPAYKRKALYSAVPAGFYVTEGRKDIEPEAERREGVHAFV